MSFAVWACRLPTDWTRPEPQRPPTRLTFAGYPGRRNSARTGPWHQSPGRPLTRSVSQLRTVGIGGAAPEIDNYEGGP